MSRATTTKSLDLKQPSATTRESTSRSRSARPRAISPSKEKSQHQPGLITRGRRVANPQLMLRSAMPIAERMLAIVIPCSRKRVRIRSASVLSSWRRRLMALFRTLFESLGICDRRAALFVERASSLACLSSSMSESSPLSFSIRSRISCWISVSSVSVSFRRSLAKCFSTSDFGCRWRLASRAC